MGQIERYGVFALCLVIFLILGIAVWGGDAAKPTPPDPGKSAAAETPPKEAAKPPDLLKPDPRREDAQKAPEGANEIPRGTFQDVNAGKPQGGLTPTPEERPAPPADARTYRIKKNDTLESIARKELKDSRGVEKLMELNPGIDSTKLQIGQTIRLPGAASAHDERPAEGLRPEQADWPKKHKVAPRESLASIARRYYGDERQHALLARANGIRDEHKLQVGAMLTIPQPGKP